ncbi:MAG TPA: geranylgeranylglyceryl/heptaprenylglyceryl phosphate synthase [Thermoprotei archaeon]|nr:geranylgeranylglyceryl/heptaprenylglyceryl phosphate synthase [Thermoprotei archaeon]
MINVGKVEEYIHREIRKRGAIHMTLIDPDKCDPETAGKIASAAMRGGTSAIMVGGSLGVGSSETDEIVKAIKEKVTCPVILFPGSIAGLSRYADAVWFLSVLNSMNTYFITGAQMQAALLVKRYGIESIPLAYIIVGNGGAVGFVSQAQILPYTREDLIASYALTGQMLGFRFVYLEAGSGGTPIPARIIKFVKKVIDIPLIVGGGIRNGETAKNIVSAGADIIVTGTVIEEAKNVEEKIREIVMGMQSGVLLKEKKIS